MTRSFGLRDLALLWTLRDQGITLDMQRAALCEARPLQEALCGLMPARTPATLTYVCHGHGANNGRGFVQVRAYPERQEWQIVHLAPRAEAGDLSFGPLWACALSELCVLAGRRGVLDFTRGRMGRTMLPAAPPARRGGGLGGGGGRGRARAARGRPRGRAGGGTPGPRAAGGGARAAPLEWSPEAGQLDCS
ncbi:MAG: hypothetical protein K6V36_14875, partial [Anaerolineae bacterium]|nr:hypothetical protein [Anaerolineae bacterium]